MKRNQAERQLQATLEVRIQDIYDALDKVGLPKSIANVVEVSNFVENTAIDAANTALLDWIQQHQQEV